MANVTASQCDAKISSNQSVVLKCPHGRQRYRCKECGGSGICEHGRRRSQCRECKGSGICGHGYYRSKCKECKGVSICEHERQRFQCKECGTHAGLKKAGFTKDEINQIGRIEICQFPRCTIRRPTKFCSDHDHKDGVLSRESYRGEVCNGCNIRLADLDKHPEWATPEILEFMKRRPFNSALTSTKV